MVAQLRRKALDRLIAGRGFVRVTDAAVELGVSEVTLRGDLAALVAGGSVVRVHGGAMPADAFTDRETPLEASRDTGASAKRGIAASAARLVASGTSVYLDAGSTALALADALVDRVELHDVTVMTSALPIALALESHLDRFTVVVTGGTLRALQHSLVGPFAAPMLEQLAVDLAFIGCTGVHATGGVTNVNLAEAEVKSRVVSRARRAVVLADATKLGRVELALVAPLPSFDSLITDAGAAPEVLAALRAAGLDVVLAA